MSLSRRAGPLFTDLYELTMSAGYYARRLFSPATFSLYIRDLPAERNYLVAAGLQDALEELETFSFSEEELYYLKNSRLFSDEFLSCLKTLRFSGHVRAMPEGTIFFANEPILEVTAPVMEAQLLETFLLNTIGFSTLIASKAARCFHAAAGRSLIDFSFRRTHGLDAGLKVARSAYIAGFTATSNVLAGKIYDIPISGTMAHSYVTAFGTEREAFAAYADTFPANSVFLIDTYDTLEGAKNAVSVAKDMKKKGQSLLAVRLDSGDMADLSKKVRRILDDAGLFDVKIVASSGFDEYKIAQVISEGAWIDAFGVGTKVGVSADAPYLDVVFKMVRFNDRNVRKLSTGKVTLAGEKQVFRKSEKSGRYAEDILGLKDETIPDANPLLEEVMKHGKCLRPHPSLEVIRERFKKNFSLLDAQYKSLQSPAAYPVKLSKRLKAAQR